MSIELPEAQILAEQMSIELLQKQIKSFHLQDYQKLQKIGFINKDIKAFDQLVNMKVESIKSRGNVIRVKLDLSLNLILAPEYGGKILYHKSGSTVPNKYHLKLNFSDDTSLTITLTGMGVIQTLKNDELERSYVYRRDFSKVASPTDEREFTLESFSKQLTQKKTNIKSSLVGKDAVTVGLSNSAFQDILFRAKIHPKRKAFELSEDERHALYDAIKTLIRERIRLGGKDRFIDLYGKQGRYTPAMGPNMSGKKCIVCGTPIEKLSLGGGQVYFCPKCQK
ncbi:MAG TPA: zinc finger domain-containing protein [Acidobacteriota bacterium]|nr:zinc finger domain-containing protein [Acidobacteriota bacterium]